eukprot:s6713_g1.t1
MLLGVFVIWIIMVSSRCCAPCCCQDTMPNVPSPCPLGPLNMAMNPKILDYPFMIGIGGEVVTTAPTGDNMMVLQLTRFLWVGLTTLGAFCAFRRFVMMRQRQLAGGGEVPSGMELMEVVLRRMQTDAQGSNSQVSRFANMLLARAETSATEPEAFGGINDPSEDEEDAADVGAGSDQLFPLSFETCLKAMATELKDAEGTGEKLESCSADEVDCVVGDLCPEALTALAAALAKRQAAAKSREEEAFQRQVAAKLASVAKGSDSDHFFHGLTCALTATLQKQYATHVAEATSAIQRAHDESLEKERTAFRSDLLSLAERVAPKPGDVGATSETTTEPVLSLR